MQRALTKSKEERFQTTLEFAEGLKTWLNGSTTAELYLPKEDKTAAPPPEPAPAQSTPAAEPEPDPEPEAGPPSELTTGEGGGPSKGLVIGLVVGFSLLFLAVVALVIILMGFMT
jgi:hypothetical protein